MTRPHSTLVKMRRATTKTPTLQSLMQGSGSLSKPDRCAMATHWKLQAHRHLQQW